MQKKCNTMCWCFFSDPASSSGEEEKMICSGIQKQSFFLVSRKWWPYKPSSKPVIFSYCPKHQKVLACFTKVSNWTGQCSTLWAFQFLYRRTMLTVTVALIHFFIEGFVTSSSRIWRTESASTILEERDSRRDSNPKSWSKLPNNPINKKEMLQAEPKGTCLDEPSCQSRHAYVKSASSYSIQTLEEMFVVHFLEKILNLLSNPQKLSKKKCLWQS